MNCYGATFWTERHYASVGYTVTKTMEDAGCDLELALSWAGAAKNSLKKWMTLFQTNLFSGEASLNSKLPALEGNHLKQIVASNGNAMDTAREVFIQSESSDRIWHALQYQIRTFRAVHYFTGGTAFYKRENNSQWPGRAIGKDSKQKKLNIKVFMSMFMHALLLTK